MQRATRWLAVVALVAAACASPEERLAHHVERGEAFLRDNEVDAALLEFQSALKIQPANAALYERIGDVLMEYRQLYPPFEHHVSIVDLIFSEGSDARSYLKSFR